MSAAIPSRRSFLRGLASLPLIGGSLALIGQPTAAAVPITDLMLDSYEAFLDYERSWLRFERYGERARTRPSLNLYEAVFINRATGELFEATKVNNPGARFEHTNPMPSTRAAVILSAAGVPIGGSA